MSANDLRPWLKCLIAYRDDGICTWCGKPITTSGRATALPYWPGRWEKAQTVIYGDHAVVDHLDKLFKSGGGITRLNGMMQADNLALMHKSCNSKKAAAGDFENELQIEAAQKWINEQEAEAALEALGYSRTQIQADRSTGRELFRLLAADLGRRHLPPPPPKKTRKRRREQIRG